MKWLRLPEKATIDSVRRSLAYYRKDLPRISVLLLLIGCSTALGFLQAWPLAVLVDTALGPSMGDSWMHWLFLAPFPDDPVKRIAFSRCCCAWLKS
jgi:subfamily B ATP-binding cassette protein MsbA